MCVICEAGPDVDDGLCARCAAIADRYMDALAEAVRRDDTVSLAALADAVEDER